MYDHDVIAEAGDLRVRLEYDHREDFPDFIQSTVIPMNDRFLDFNDGYGYGPMVRGAWRDHTFEVIERWLKIFHDVRDIGTVETRDASYLVLLTGDAVEYYGTPDDRLRECVDGDTDNFRQWVEGEVYGYVVERRVLWGRVSPPAPASEAELVEVGGDTLMVTWEEIDSLWDLFGREYAEDEARAALESEAAA